MDHEQTIRETSGPTMDRERINSLDVLRGFALMGILVMNIQVFSMPIMVYYFPNTFGSLDGINGVVWCIGYVFFNLKFMSMFSMLFGAGIVLMSQHRDAAGKPFLRIHFRRMFLLLFFGLVHAYLIWSGDILVSYAIAGFFVVWARKWRPSRLLIAGGILIIIGSMIYTALGLYGHFDPEGVNNVREANAASMEDYQQEIDAYQGSWTDHLPLRIGESLSFHLSLMPLSYFWHVCGLMCIGMALFKWKILSAERSTSFYVRMALIGGAIGIPLSAFGAYSDIKHDFDFVHVFGFGFTFNYFGSVFVAFMWIALIMLLCRAKGFSKLKTMLSCYGRMAFTNYIGQTLLATWVFYGYGLGLFGTVSRIEQVAVVVLIWTVQLILSPIWLRYFRFGPLEWLWRSGVYFRFQSMRRKPSGETEQS